MQKNLFIKASSTAISSTPAYLPFRVTVLSTNTLAGVINMPPFFTNPLEN